LNIISIEYSKVYQTGPPGGDLGLRKT